MTNKTTEWRELLPAPWAQALEGYYGRADMSPKAVLTAILNHTGARIDVETFELLALLLYNVDLEDPAVVAGGVGKLGQCIAGVRARNQNIPVSFVTSYFHRYPFDTVEAVVDLCVRSWE